MPNANNPHLIHVRDVYKIYQRDQEKVEALHGIQLDVEQGAFVAIMGSSGGGKSTMLHFWVGSTGLPAVRFPLKRLHWNGPVKEN